ncbi:MAG: hypothetical protein LBT41_03760 [Candidatus Methanoplasma sp.]|jgi:hypothetical protein|nr:hypothetical protein [Candidatus Methanoplasma sp.]
MLFKRSDVPAEAAKAGMSEWYGRLSEQDKVRASRYSSGADASSAAAFALSFMRKANDEANYGISSNIGECAIRTTDGMERFEILEELIAADFGRSEYDLCLERCEEGLAMIPDLLGKLKASNGGVIPERLRCRNTKINVLVGVRFDYDAGDAALEEFHRMGILSSEDLNFRKQSLRVYRLQRSFDGVFAVKLKE